MNIFSVLQQWIRRMFALSLILPVLVLICLNAPAQAYTMPKGVPNAWIDPDITAPGRPSPWTTEQVGYYYIDWNTGTNTGRTYGTPTAPRKNIPTTIPAGSRVELAPGSYGGGIQLIVAANGNSLPWEAGVSGPAWLIGAPDLASVFTMKTIMQGSYFYISGIKWMKPSSHTLLIGSGSVSRPVDHFLLRNCDIDGSGQLGALGMTLEGRADGKVANVIIYNNEIHGFGNMAATTDAEADNSAFATGNEVSNVWFVKNRCHTCTAGVRAGAAGTINGQAICSRFYLADCEVFNILQHGMTVKFCIDAVISSNYIHDIIDTPWSPSKCIGAQYAPQGLWIIFNRLHGGRYGVFLGSTTTSEVTDWPVYIIGNIITGTRQPSGTYTNGGGYGNGAIGIWGSRERYVIGNTLYDNCAGVLTPPVAADSLTEIRNNIISNISDDRGTDVTGGFHIVAGGGALDQNIHIDNNLYYDGGTTSRIRWNNNNYTVAELRAATGQGDKDIAADPVFVGAESGDFRTKGGSPIINAGDATLINVLEEKFLSTFGTSIKSDFNGTMRLPGAPDIGAIEYRDGDANAVSPPRNLRVIPEK